MNICLYVILSEGRSTAPSNVIPSAVILSVVEILTPFEFRLRLRSAQYDGTVTNSRAKHKYSPLVLTEWVKWVIIKKVFDVDYSIWIVFIDYYCPMPYYLEA